MEGKDDIPKQGTLTTGKPEMIQRLSVRADLSSADFKKHRDSPRLTSWGRYSLSGYEGA